jgi:hypothetical protein
LNAQNVSQELWNSEQVSARDSIGNFAKFVPPTVANGKVYMATFSNKLNVYGLFPSPTLLISGAQQGIVLSWSTNSYGPFLLQFKSNLSDTNWQNVTAPIIVTNGANQVSLSATDTATFYRLKR